MYLANQVYPEESICLYNAYPDATQRPYVYERRPEVSNQRIPER